MNIISFSAHKPHGKSYRASICLFGGYHICFGATKSNSWNWYIYFSRNATPWASTLYFGTNWREKFAAKIRRKKFGLLFNPHTNEATSASIEISKAMRFV